MVQAWELLLPDLCWSGEEGGYHRSGWVPGDGEGQGTGVWGVQRKWITEGPEQTWSLLLPGYDMTVDWDEGGAALICCCLICVNLGRHRSGWVPGKDTGQGIAVL